MGGVLRVYQSSRCRLAVNGASAALALGLGVLAARHFAAVGWPFSRANLTLVLLSAGFFLAAYALKAYGWQRLFAPHERPRPLALAAAGGAASVTGAALPGRFDDVVRIAVVRRYPGCRSGVGALCLSLFMLGLIDAAALVPLASTAAATSNVSGAVRAALGIVAAGGVGAAILVALLPRIARSGRLIRFRVCRWISEHAMCPREAWKAWVLVLASWLVRAVAVFLLLAALGFTLSFPLAVAFLVAAAASGALPVAPAGAATQAGAGAAILIASGIGTSQAIAFAVAAQALLILAGAAVVLVAAAWQGGVRLGAMRAAA